MDTKLQLIYPIGVKPGVLLILDHRKDHCVYHATRTMQTDQYSPHTHSVLTESMQTGPSDYYTLMTELHQYALGKEIKSKIL